MGTQSKRRKGTRDTREITSDLKRQQDQDALRTAIQPTFEGTLYTVPIVTSMDYCNVIETIDANQTGGPQPPGQTVGLAVTVAGNSQLNLNWTTSTGPNLDHYNVYKSTTNGFTADSSNRIAQPITNSYQNTGLLAGTAYYYRVSAVNTSQQEGALSVQATGTTSGSAPPATPNFLLHLDNNFTDSANGIVVNGFNNNGFVSPGKFGSHAWKCNTPVTPSGRDYLYVNSVQSNLTMDTTVGFSISMYVYPTDITGNILPNRRVLINRTDSTPDPQYSLEVGSDGTVFWFVKKAGIDYARRSIAVLSLNTWQHIAATFNGATNTVALYVDGVAGSNSGATPEYEGAFGLWIGAGISPPDSYYEGYLDEIQYYKGYVFTTTNVTNLKNNNTL